MVQVRVTSNSQGSTLSLFHFPTVERKFESPRCRIQFCSIKLIKLYNSHAIPLRKDPIITHVVHISGYTEYYKS